MAIKGKATIYRGKWEGGTKESFFITWAFENGKPVGGHEIGYVDESREKLLNSLLEIIELPSGEEGNAQPS